MSTSDTMHQRDLQGPVVTLNAKGAPFRVARIVLLLGIPVLTLLVFVGLLVSGQGQWSASSVLVWPMLVSLLAGAALTVLAKRRLGL